MGKKKKEAMLNHFGKLYVGSNMTRRKSVMGYLCMQLQTHKVYRYDTV